MALSARNQLPAKVTNVKLGAVMAEVVVKLTGGEEVVSLITVESVKNLGLEPGTNVKVIIKSTEVMLSTD